MKVFPQHSKSNEYIFKWLILGAVLIVLMVVIGGITRLTQSGLSMVKWEPIMGTLPPLSEHEWLETFELYKQSPEFHHYNSDFALSDFKSIFFWEYLHRLIARIIGIVFILPFFVFWIKKWFTTKLFRQVIVIFSMGLFQGVLGWFMVKSGLVDKPHVSHYRLAAHLITALILIVYMFWVAINLKYYNASADRTKEKRLSWIFVGIVFIQIAYGAFVAGLKGGKMYNTFPKMGADWIPSNFERIINRNGFSSLLDSPGLVQFVHRIIAFILLFYLVYLWKRLRQVDLTVYQSRAFKVLLFAVGIQFVLGVITLLLAVPVTFGVLHQVGAIFVLLAAVTLIFTLNNNTTQYDNL